MPGGCRAHRTLRRWWPDGNLLRRRADRAEAVILALLIAVLAVFGPVSALAAGGSAYRAAARADRAGQAGRHQVTAVLLVSARPALSAFGGLGLVPAPARWTAPNGIQRHGTKPQAVEHRGEVEVLPGTQAGAKVTTWVDAAGQPADAPLPGWRVAGQGLLAGLLAGAGVALLLAVAWLLARLWLDRRRLAAWESAWRSTAPRWTTPR
jgi:hypothetical protein